MKNITVAVPEDVYRTARIKAAEQGRSVSALVAEYLRSLSDDDAEFARLQALQQQTQAEISRFRAADRIGRDEVQIGRASCRERGQRGEVAGGVRTQSDDGR